MKPIILISGGTAAAANGTPTWSLNRNYSDNIRRAGGIPILAVDEQVVEEYADMAQGLLLSGGKDVATDLYRQEQRFENIIVDAARDSLEWKLIEAFLKRKKPIWGICRGIQILNVYFGGTLYQDIPSELGGMHSGGVSHPTRLLPGSILGKLYGDELITNSYHHQVIDRLAEDFVATGWAMAGETEVVEAFEHRELPIWAVQWHPERMTPCESTPVTVPQDARDSLPMFRYFVDQCRE